MFPQDFMLSPYDPIYGYGYPPMPIYDPKSIKVVCNLDDVLSKAYYSRNHMINDVRNIARIYGFNICIPRGDIKYKGGSQQVVLYCDRYGKRRRKSKDCKTRGTKKTGCQWKIKFQKQSNGDKFVLIPSKSCFHNHRLEPKTGTKVPDIHDIYKEIDEAKSYISESESARPDKIDDTYNMLEETFPGFSDSEGKIDELIKQETI
ncbi:unnamed protein product [Moneuplotes crassus]|uniref:FAR1 domain-containing protein n=1 Tax=Euplotes crassus TaxID=5936 RepID=A0AAD1XB45_EUPCR|nr:unnamed protein product [Moneuplotes crassus]